MLYLPPKSRARWAAFTAVLAASLLPVAQAVAQGMPRHSGDVGANAALSTALIRLNRNPRDTEALITAGNAALATGDTDAAIGFFTRADRIAPGTSRIEAGLASAKVRAQDPFSAIPLFIAAEKDGPIRPELLGDRGLAYDLIGDNANAQQYYRQALALRGQQGADAEVARRLALSLAIAGDRRGSETMLATLLQKQDRAAWRTRIFALAILGYEEEAVATAKSTMPPDLAVQIAPYLRYMRRLTPAQQAAAANLGHFPQAAMIGQDDPRIAQYARLLDRSHPAGGPPAADRGLVPAGAPLGSSAQSQLANAKAPGKHRKDRQQDSDRGALSAGAVALRDRNEINDPAPPEVLASRDTQAAGSPLLAGPGLLAASPPSASAVPLPVAATLHPAAPASGFMGPVLQPRTTAALARAPVAGPTVLLPARPADRAPSVTLVPVPVSAPRPHVPGQTARASFSEAFSAMSPVMVDITPERGAVDLRRISPARAAPKPPPPPSHPSRIWVELGVGRDTDRITFDWRRMVKDDPELFRGRKAFVSAWARTNRLLVGPFESDKAATSFTDRLHKADHPSAFVWTSPAGQVVDPLDGD